MLDEERWVGGNVAQGLSYRCHRCGGGWAWCRPGARNHPRTAVTAICDINEALCQQVSEALGGVKVYHDFRDLVRDSDIDLVYIAVPPKLHRAVALEAFAAEKHVFCEKPLALTLAEATEMADAAEQSGRIHALHLPLHYDAGIQALQNAYRSGYVGEFRGADLQLVFPEWPRTWQRNGWVGKREQGGAIREVCPHWFHFVLETLGPIKRVFAGMEYPELDVEGSEIRASGVLELETGRSVYVTLTCGVAHEGVVSFTNHGTEGTLALRGWDNPFGAKLGATLEPLAKAEPGATTRTSLVDNLVQALDGQPASLVDFHMGREIQRVLEAWEQSAESGSWVSL